MTAPADTDTLAPQAAAGPRLLQGKTPWGWLAGAVIFLIVTRWLLSPAPSWDQSEQLVWSQQLAWGYGPQPPLYTWLQWLLNQVLGPSLWSVTVLKNLLLGSTFVFMFLAARWIMPAPQAWLAAFGLIWLPGVAWSVLRDQTHTVLLCSAIAATWWALLRQLRQPRPAGFLLLGLIMAWGLLAKYSYAVVMAALTVAALSVPQARRALFSRGWWLAPLVTALLVAPHALWIVTHWQSASAATLHKLAPHAATSWLHGAARGFGDLLLYCAVAVLPWWWLARHCWGKQLWREARESATADAWRDTALALLSRSLVLAIVPLVCMVLAGTSSFEGRWIQPLLLALPLLGLAARPQLHRHTAGVRRYLGACLILAVTLWGLVMLAPAVDALRGRGDRLNWPVQALGDTLHSAGFDGHGLIIAGHHTLAGVLRARFPAADLVVCSTEQADAVACVSRHARRAQAQGLQLLLVQAEDPPPPVWWAAAWPDSPAPALQDLHLPYRWTDPGRAALRLQFRLSPLPLGLARTGMGHRSATRS